MSAAPKTGAVLDPALPKALVQTQTPNGKIRIFIKNLSEKIAAVEARVYFDRADSEPAANCIISGVDPRTRCPWRKPSTTLWKKRSRTQASACSLFPSIPLP